MKKLIAILLTGLLAFTLFACKDNPPDPSGNTTTTQSAQGPAQDIYFAPKGVKLELGAAPAPALEALGEPVVTLECPSCALQAKDIDYTYQGFKLTVTYPEQGDDYITGIKLLDDTYTIPGGVTIGSTSEAVFAAWGTADKEDNGFYYYTQGLSTLKITVANDKVTQILYEYDWDNA